MFILAHIGITIFVLSLVYFPVLGAGIGAILPDVIDKLLFVFHIFPCGRFLAHSIFLFPIAGMLSFIVTKNKKFAIAISLGVLFHLIEDFHNIPWFYPFVNYSWLKTCGVFEVKIGIYEIIAETIGATLLIFTLGVRSKLISFRRKLWDFINRIRK